MVKNHRLLLQKASNGRLLTFETSKIVSTFKAMRMLTDNSLKTNFLIKILTVTNEKNSNFCISSVCRRYVGKHHFMWL